MKKPELTATSVEKFLIEKFDSVSDLMQLSEGEESRAFSFDVGGRGYVLRGFCRIKKFKTSFSTGIIH